MQKPVLNEHLGFLDGIRGLAALWVVVGHCMIWGGSVWYRFPAPIIAVDVFMFVSGYLMVHQWNRRVGEGIELPWSSVGEFWLRRCFRIIPVFWLALIAMVVLRAPLTDGVTVLQGGQSGGIYDPALFPMDPLNLILRATFLFGFVPQLAASPFMGDWSLALEMQFYAAFPFLLVALRKRGATVLLFGSWALAFLTNEVLIRMPEYRPGVGTALPLPILLPLKLTIFLIGMAIAEANRQFRANPAATALVVVLALFFAAMQSWQVAGVAAIAFYLVAGREFSGKLAGRSGTDWLRLALGNRLMVFLADCSYPVYLLHSMAIPLWGRWLWRQDWAHALRNPVRMLLLLVLVTATVYPLAWLVHRFVERPGIEAGRHVGKRLFPGKTQRPVSRAA